MGSFPDAAGAAEHRVHRSCDPLCAGDFDCGSGRALSADSGLCRIKELYGEFPQLEIGVAGFPGAYQRIPGCDDDYHRPAIPESVPCRYRLRLQESVLL